MIWLRCYLTICKFRQVRWQSRCCQKNQRPVPLLGIDRSNIFVKYWPYLHSACSLMHCSFSNTSEPMNIFTYLQLVKGIQEAVHLHTLGINHEQELSVPVSRFPPTPVCPSVQLGEGGADHVNLAPALLTFDFERMSCCPRIWWCEPSTCPLHSQTCQDGLVGFGLKALF